MKQLLLVPALVFAANNAFASPITVDMHTVSATGIGDSIGTVQISETPKGASLAVSLKGLSPGDHGFHVHQKPDCSPAIKDGAESPAEAAGGHFDPARTGHHEGPNGAGHEGDLPFITANAEGVVDQTIDTDKLKFSDFSGKSLMIHAGGDNYSDTPKPLGGGGMRIVCGAIN